MFMFVRARVTLLLPAVFRNQIRVPWSACVAYVTNKRLNLGGALGHVGNGVDPVQCRVPIVYCIEACTFNSFNEILLRSVVPYTHYPAWGWRGLLSTRLVIRYFWWRLIGRISPEIG
jgi:hypothetical protein